MLEQRTSNGVDSVAGLSHSPGVGDQGSAEPAPSEGEREDVFQAFLLISGSSLDCVS